MRHFTRLTILTAALLTAAGLGLGQLAPRLFTVSSAGRQQKGAAGQAGEPGAAPRVAPSTLRGKLGFDRWFRSLFRNDAFSLDLQTGVETRITSGTGRQSNIYVRLSPDGTKVAFRQDNFLVITKADGSNLVTVGAFSPFGLNWSRDSQYLTFERAGDIYVCDRNGLNIKRVPSRSVSGSSSNFLSPSWSPDGSKIAYVFSEANEFGQLIADVAVLTLARNADGTYVENPDGTLAVTSDERLTNRLGARTPQFSPDGSKIAFYKYTFVTPQVNNADIFVMNADGSNPVNLTNSDDYNDGPATDTGTPVWSPDGSKIAFWRQQRIRREVFGDYETAVINPDGSGLAIIPTGSPDDTIGSWIDPCTVSALRRAALLKGAKWKAVTASRAEDEVAALAEFKCIKEIVVNVTTDNPDTDTTDEFCDTDADEIGNQCSLRAAIQEANERPGADYITFDIPGDGLHTIAPASELPDITQQVAIDATTQPGYADNAPVVELSGAAAGAANGFNVRAEGVRIAGLIINRFSMNGVTDKGNGIYALDTSGLRVESCFIGTDATGTAAAPNSNIGVYLRNTTDSTIGGHYDSSGNLISGNGLGTAESPGFGVSILGAESIPRGDNSVIGNRIGTDRTGANALGNKSAGVIVALSTHNQIGGETDAPGVAPGNVITGDSPNSGVGVFLLSANHNTVAGNLIGTDATGTKGFGNGLGVYLSTGSTNNTIGGYSTQARNVISGNKVGVDLFGTFVNENYVVGNYVGTDVTGQAIVPITGVPDYPQQRRGITVEGGSRNEIGGSDNGIFGNVVAGNAEVQISVLRDEATDNQVAGNYIGLFADGATSPTYDPREIGLWIVGATGTAIGDSFSDARNVISGNGLVGVLITNPMNHLNANNKLVGNYIGTNAAGTLARPNGSGGILIARSSNNLVEGNIISGNGGIGGLAIANQGSQQSSSAALGSKPFAAAYPASASKISAASALSNAIALLRERGDSVSQQDKGDSAAQAEETAETKNNIVRKNYIGTSADGQMAIPNALAGIFVGPGANENSIGEANRGNVISGNNGAGVLIGNTEQSTLSPTANKIQGNIIGLNASATAKVPNTTQGVSILFGAGTIIGGDTENAGNVIAGNGQSGIAIVGTSNIVRFNFIGTNREGALDLGNTGDGIKLENVQDNDNEISDNTIAGNGGDGIYVIGASGAPITSAARKPNQGVFGRLKLSGNSIGVFARALTPTVKIPNLRNGIEIENFVNAALGTGGAAVKKMIVSGNLLAGIKIMGANSSGNIISNSIIGTDESGTQNLGNGADGVQLVDAPNNTIGGENTEEAQNGNIIAGNAGNGIAVEGAAGGANLIQGNSIGVFKQIGSAIRAIKLPNLLNGIKVQEANGTIIGALGLPGPAQELVKNIIGGNGQMGVLLTQAQNTSIKSNLIGADEQGTPDLGNGSHGVLITGGSSQTIVGGPEEGSGNTITDNDGSGVRIDETGGAGNLVDPNTIYGNKGYGIDLGRRGVTPNDFGDADEGPNRLQNFPEITNVAVNSDGQLVVSYRLTSAPEHAGYGTPGLYVEFFKSDQRGQGQKFLGTTHYTVADYNNGVPVVKEINLGSLATLDINADDAITATASDAGGNTSEFAPPFSTRVLFVTKTDDTDDGVCDADCSLREALAKADAGNEIQFSSPLFDAAQTITLGGTELIVNKSVKITGRGAHLLTISANNLSRVFNITDGAITTLRGLTITRGNALGNFIGGGIINAGTLTLVGCHVTDNIADRGAGLYNTETLIVQASAISANKANLGSATPAGGGIQNENGGALVVSNSTISGNEATVSDGAAGIYIADGTATITNSTVTNNTAQPGASAAGGIKNAGGAVTMGNTIVAGNTAANADLLGVFTSLGYNLVGVGDAAVQPSFPPGTPNANNDIVGTSAVPVNPRLDQLNDYGGTTPTHRLQADSPALDKGKTFGELTDQRGQPRPSDDLNLSNAADGDGSDIGAYETQVAATPAAISGHVTLAGTPLGGVTVTLTRPDSTTATTTTDADGLYTFADLVPGGYSVTPTRTHFSFTPPSRSVPLNGVDSAGIDFAAASTAPDPQPANGAVLISEFRPSGTTADDEYVELYNNADAAIDISGFRLESTAGPVITFPADTILPARAHYLVAHQTGYTLTGYATADQTYSGFDLPVAAGLALYNAAGVIVDAVGLGTTPAPYREGAALPSVNEAGQYAFVRKLASGAPLDSGDNAADFAFVSTDGGNYGVQSTLGAPGPENSASPIQRNTQLKASLIEPQQASTAAPNRMRDTTPHVCNGGSAPSNCTFGTLDIRRRFRNVTGQTLTQLRFRIVDITAGAAPAGTADLRALSGATVMLATATSIGVTSVLPTTVETPPAQPGGGGLNTSLLVTLPGGGLAHMATVDLHFLLGVQQTGSFRFFINVEALTGAAGRVGKTTGAKSVGWHR